VRAPLTIEQILAWADEHHARTGRWPTQHSGWVTADPNQDWHAIDLALRQGFRGLPGGDSLPRLLARARGLPERAPRPPLTAELILAWADAHRARAKRWPGVLSGPIHEAPGENWRAVNLALYQGHRGLPGGDSLRRLLRRNGRR
jgi:hypothetical protein